jgi:ferredoxin-type protein NapH
VRRLRRWIPLAAGVVLLVLGFVRDEMPGVREAATYRDFDVPSRQSGVEYLSPGVPDRAHEGAYSFDKVHAGPLYALGTVFLVFWVLRNVGSLDARLGIRRGVAQWLVFVGARLGMFRVAGVARVPRCGAGVLPVLNCQACEMATGACPIGQVQASLLDRRLPLLALGTIVAAAALLGRFVCGWLCPFGLFSDILDRVSLKRIRPRHGWRVGGLVVAASLVVGAVALAGTRTSPFCSTVCASGKLYGLLPYYATTAAGDVARLRLADAGSLLYHAALFALFLVLAVLISGRVFCRYACPLGATLGLAHRVALVRVVHRAESCNGCDRCLPACPMGIDLARNDFLTRTSCISCGRCVAVCARGARAWDLPWARAAAPQARANRHGPSKPPPQPVAAR